MSTTSLPQDFLNAVKDLENEYINKVERARETAPWTIKEINENYDKDFVDLFKKYDINEAEYHNFIASQAETEEGWMSDMAGR